MRFKVFFILLLVISCAQKLDVNQETLLFNSYTDTSAHLTCNVFSDKTFQGKIWSSESSENCFFLNIDAALSSFFKTENLFLQIYPFSIKAEKVNYGDSSEITTIKRSKQNKNPLMISKVIDLDQVQAKLGLNPDNFFIDHSLEICDLGLEWDGIQLTLYLRKINSNLPLRTTKVLLPPILTHPVHYQETRGVALGALHPFFDKISTWQPSQYYNQAERMCSN